MPIKIKGEKKGKKQVTIAKD